MEFCTCSPVPALEFSLAVRVKGGNNKEQPQEYSGIACISFGKKTKKV